MIVKEKWEYKIARLKNRVLNSQKVPIYDIRQTYKSTEIIYGDQVAVVEEDHVDTDTLKVLLLLHLVLSLNLPWRNSMKGMEAAINIINAAIQKMMDDAEARHNDYMQHRHADMTCLEQELEYGPSPYESLGPTLFKLTQTTTVYEYYSTFTALANRTPGLSPNAILDCFVSGLKPDLRRDVIAQNLISLSKALSLAKHFEEKYTSLTKLIPQPKKSFSNSNPHSLTRPTNTLLPTPSTHSQPPTSRARPIRSITAGEIQLWRDKGQCFYYDEKFSPTHRCPNKHYLLLQVDDLDPPEPETDPPDSDPLLVVLESEHHLSFHALKGVYSAGTIGFQGQIQGVQIQVLLDSGSSDNFLQPRIAQCLKLTIHEASQFQVLVGNGSTLTTSRLIQDLPVTIQGHTLHLSVYLLPITSADLVLGAPWLKTLGPHIADYEALSIKFYLNNKFITLRAQPSSTASLENLLVDLATLLHNYWNVFDEPTRLPPPRDQDHLISLIDGSNPVKVKFYRYPHSQKAEIENMVSEMLKQGIIEPNTSPFSSPVLLVKKKDRSWRFCTDYRALNAITIKDSFPIPTVDELLDELFGAAYFSKLDLQSRYHQILVHPENRRKTGFRTHQDFRLPFTLETDASGSGIGAVLSQARHPIAYFSKKLWHRIQKQSAYVRELYAITEALEKFRHYLIGHKFVIKTDQHNLKSLTDQSIQTPEQQHWLHKYLGYDFTVEIKPGIDNIAADSLSYFFCLALSMQTPQLISMISIAVNNDPSLAEIRNQCLLGTNSTPHY
ncbi:uncharacterized protein [Cicer arietinum]|uniref:uncharacterized protein n=1 Tax=Cicer arietinum TaxID=3827 RepID=UPI003CC60AB2